ncbi:MAG: hypothetical protein Q7K34_00235 [archaeon]|nr:hypothetical protein [archaeon]
MKKKTLLVALFFLFAGIYAQAQLACTQNNQCDDSNPSTADLCVRPGTEQAGCTNLACKPACNSDSDCGDGDPATADVCAGAGRCSSVCVGLSKCGDGALDEGETKCTCPADAGACSGTQNYSSCSESACIGTECKSTIMLGCCGNNICEFGESFSSCAVDCSPKNIEITLEGVNEDNFFVRGENVLFKAGVSADGVPVKNAFVSVKGFFGELKLLNDGRHGDGQNDDQVYANTLILPKEIQADTFKVTIEVLFDGTRGIKDFNFVVSPQLDVRIETGQETYQLGSEIKLSGIVLRKNTAIKTTVDLSIYSNNIKVFGKKIQANDIGEFSYSYRTSFLESQGEWRIEAFASDESGNTGLFEKNILVSDSKITSYLGFEVLQEIRGTYNRGESVFLSIKVSRGLGEPVNGAVVLAILPDNTSIEFAEKEAGVYEAEIPVSLAFPLGKQELRINAVKEQPDQTISAGSMPVSFFVQKVPLSIELIEPREFSFQVGEEITFLARVFYPDKKPVVSPKVIATINGAPFAMQQVSKGVYVGKYVASETSGPFAGFFMEVDDGFENNGSAEMEVEISGVSYLHYLRKYTASIALAGIAALFGLVLAAVKIAFRRHTKLLEKEKAIILDKMRNIQLQYFREGSIDKKNYDRVMDELKTRLEYVEKTLSEEKQKKGVSKK